MLASGRRRPYRTKLIRRLTLPSRGRPTGYALRPPLMSNVRRLVFRCSEAVVAPAFRSLARTGRARARVPGCRRRSTRFALACAVFIESRPSCGGLLTSGGARTTPAFLEQAAPFKCTTPLRSVAALRHSQSNAVRYGRPILKPSLNATSPMCSCSSNRSTGCAGPERPAHLSPKANPPPNPSIERTSSGLWPPAAAHVKR